MKNSGRKKINVELPNFSCTWSNIRCSLAKYPKYININETKAISKLQGKNTYLLIEYPIIVKNRQKNILITSFLPSILLK